MKINIQEWVSSDNAVEMLSQFKATGTLSIELPELVALEGIPQSAQWHPEIDTYVHTEMVLSMACRLTKRPRARYAALVHDLGKALTPGHELPKHVNHEERGVPLTKAVAERFNLPEDWNWLGQATSRYHLMAHQVFTLKATTIAKFLKKSGFLEQGEDMFEDFLIACEADKRGRLGMFEHDYPQGVFLREVFEAIKDITHEDETQCHVLRTNKIKKILPQHKSKESHAT